MNHIDELRESMKSASVSGSGQNFVAGRYLLEIKNIFYKRSLNAGMVKQSIIAEFTVIECSNPEVAVGETRSTVFAYHNLGWLGRLKALLLAAMGVNPSGAVSAEASEAVTDIYVALVEDSERIRMGLPENFMAGRRVRAEGIDGTNAAKTVNIVKMTWSPV